MGSGIALSVGMPCYDDFSGVYFTVQHLRLDGDMSDVELVVVDNNPTSKDGETTAAFTRGWAAPGLANVKYVAEPRKWGPAWAKDRVFREASGDAVLCMDCHVLVQPGAIRRLINWYKANPNSMDLLTGPLRLDSLQGVQTHFDPRWRGEMYGTWGAAMQCRCGATRIAVVDVEGGMARYRYLTGADDPLPTVSCETCGAAVSEVPWAGHERFLHEGGFRPLGMLDDDPEFEIPGQGCGLFSCRRDAWLGFNPHFRGFGGEEMYIHEKVRQAGRKNLCLPWLKWVHRFGRPGGAPYALPRYAKVRNYVIGHQELGLPLDAVHKHFVASGLLPQAEWDWLLADPVGHEEPPKPVGCGTCGAGSRIADDTTLEQLYERASKTPSDISEHCVKLRELASQSDTVVEFGHRRGVSTTALLSGQPKVLQSYDINEDPFWKELKKRQGKTEFSFTQADVREIEIPECTLLFEDSKHTEAHVTAILEKHAPKVKRWIAFHDTAAGTFGEAGEDGGPGILVALRKFLRKHPEWSVVYAVQNNHGLTVISRDPNDKPKLPGVATMAWNLTKAMAAHVAGGAKTSTEEVAQARLDVCTTCPQRTGERCSQCGCYLEPKAALAVSECPLGFWPE